MESSRGIKKSFYLVTFLYATDMFPRILISSQKKFKVRYCIYTYIYIVFNKQKCTVICDSHTDDAYKLVFLYNL